LLDMVLSDDRRIDWFVEEFFRGNYTFQGTGAPASTPPEVQTPRSEGRSNSDLA
jgi:pyruvate,water dikinase